MKTGLSGWVVALALLGGLVWVGLLARSHITGTASVLDRFETILLDLRITLNGKRSPSSDVVIVAIDDQTLALTGKYPLPRSRLSELINIINEAGAKALALDILLSDTSAPEQDNSLSKAIGGIPTVLAAAGQLNEEPPSANLVPTITSTLHPAPAISEFSAVGLANIVTDSGGTPRHIPQLFQTPGGLQQSFSLRSVSLFLQEAPAITKSGLRFGEQSRSLDLGWHLALNYYGPRGTIPTISAKALFDGTPQILAQLENRLVILGVTATAVGDRFSTPFDPIMPGVEVQATGMANLIDGSHLIRNANTRLLDAVAALIITLVGMAVVIVLPLAPASVVYLLLLSGWLIVISVFFAQGDWLNGALPFAASLPPVVGLIIARQIADRYQAGRHLKAQEALGRFQSPVLAKRIAEDPSFLLQPREQKVAILFVDLSGYTRFSESSGAAKTRDFLKEFHTIIVNVADKQDGIVLNFMGDGAMLGFGIPEAGQKDPLNAFGCALLLEKAITDWLEARGTQTDIGQVRVGAHFGQVVLSRLGHEAQQQITATGDIVNVASRFLEVAKTSGATIVMSADLIHSAEDATSLPLHVPRQETVALRGRREELKAGLWKVGETAASLQPLE